MFSSQLFNHKGLWINTTSALMCKYHKYCDTCFFLFLFFLLLLLKCILFVTTHLLDWNSLYCHCKILERAFVRWPKFWMAEENQTNATNAAETDHLLTCNISFNVKSQSLRTLTTATMTCSWINCLSLDHFFDPVDVGTGFRECNFLATELPISPNHHTKNDIISCADHPSSRVTLLKKWMHHFKHLLFTCFTVLTW